MVNILAGLKGRDKVRGRLAKHIFHFLACTAQRTFLRQKVPYFDVSHFCLTLALSVCLTWTIDIAELSQRGWTIDMVDRVDFMESP